MYVTRDGKKRRTESEWKRIITEYRRSGSSLRDFADQQSIPLGSLQRWNRRIGAADPPQESEFVTVAAGMPAPESWQAEIELPGGVILRLRG